MEKIIFTCNFPLIINCVKKFNFKRAFVEMVQESSFDFIRIIENYNFANGNKFSTYAVWALKKNLFRKKQRFCENKKRKAWKSNCKRLNELYYQPIDKIKEIFETNKIPNDLREAILAKAGVSFQPEIVTPLTYKEIKKRYGYSKYQLTRVMEYLKVRTSPSVYELTQEV